MRRVIIAILTLAVLGSETTLAQGRYWAGVSAGCPIVALHFGIKDVIPDLSVRLNTGYAHGGTIGFPVGADGMYDLAVNAGAAPPDLYLAAVWALGSARVPLQWLSTCS